MTEKKTGKNLITAQNKIEEMIPKLTDFGDRIYLNSDFLRSKIPAKYEGYLVWLNMIGDKVESIEVADRVRPQKVETVAKICKNGTSLTVAITKEAKLLGVGAGDQVRVTVEKL